MDIQQAVMSVPYYQARQQFEAYRALVKDRPKHATKDDVTLYRALWQITRGQKVIDISRAIADAGVNERGLPKLAIGRAHWPEVRAWRHGGRFVFSRAERPWSWEVVQRAIARNVSVRMSGEDVSGRAQTPLIPAAHRPKGSLSGYHLLWEAEWQRVVPVDPILLRHIDGPFFVVLAQWDLTPLEQAVLRQRL